MPLFHLPVFWFGYFDGFKTRSSRKVNVLSKKRFVLSIYGIINGILSIYLFVDFEIYIINKNILQLRAQLPALAKYQKDYTAEILPKMLTFLFFQH